MPVLRATVLNVAYNGGMDAREQQAIELNRQLQQMKEKLNHLNVELFGRRVLAQCKAYLPEDEAQKIAEQTYEEFIRGNYQGNSLGVALLKIATRLSSARARDIEIEQFINPNEQNPRGSLSQKDKEDRILLLLRKSGYTWVEIAEIMDMPSANAAKMRGHRALQRLQESKNVRQGT
jgi:hypothetical protein